MEAVSLSVRIDPKDKDFLGVLAKKHNVTRSVLAGSIIRAYLVKERKSKVQARTKNTNWPTQAGKQCSGETMKERRARANRHVSKMLFETVKEGSE